MGNFLKKVFADMKGSAKAQHEVDKAQLEAVKAESRAQWEEAKMTPAGRQALMQDVRDKQIKEANARTAAAQARIDLAKSRQK